MSLRSTNGKNGPKLEATQKVSLRALSSHSEKAIPSTFQVEALGGGALWEFAVQNRIESIVSHFVRENLTALFEEDARWLAAHDEWGDRIDTKIRAMDEIAEEGKKQNIKVVALKNGGIARGIFPCAACCPMGDVDLLVGKDDFRSVHEIMGRLGYAIGTRGTVESDDLDHAFESGGAEYWRNEEKEVSWIEVQWRPIAGRWIRRDQEPDGDSLLARSVGIEGTDVRTLCPEDNMIQVCLHTAKHSFVRAPGLRLHTDVDRLVKFAPPDWDEVVSIATNLSVKVPVYTSLFLANKLLETPVPKSVLEKLRPPALREELVLRWIERAGIFNPDEKKFSRPEMMAFHALLYDDFKGLVSSVFDTVPSEVRIDNVPFLLRSAFARMYDLVTRYQA